MFHNRNMSPDALTSVSPLEPDPSQDCQARLHAFRMAALERLTERGLTLLEQIQCTATDQDAPAEGNLGLSYSPIAKAVRQTLMLHARFEEDFNKTSEQKEAEAAAARAAEAQRAASAEAAPKARRKRQVRKAVTLALDLAVEEAEARSTEPLDFSHHYAELHERLEDYDEYSDFGRLPVGAVVENICRVMGLEFDPALWEHEPWATQEMAEKPEGSPYAEWQPSPRETANEDDADPDDPGDDDEDDPYGLAEEDDAPRRRSRAPP
jgi:hypothetical protein